MHPPGGTPLLDLRQLVDDENALALGPRRGLHDPHGVGVASELLHEQRVVCGEQIRDWDKFLRYGQRRVLGDVFQVPFHVFHHQIFAGQFVMVGVVVQQLHVVQSDARIGTENGADGTHTGPVDVPVHGYRRRRRR